MSAAAMVPPPETPQADEDQVTYGTFVVGSTEYALPAHAIREVVPLPAHLNPLHGTATHILGMFRLRNEVIPVVHTDSLFRGEQSDVVDDSRVAIVDAGTHVFGAIFDQTGEVLRLERSNVRSLEEGGSITKGVLCTDGDERLITVLGADSFGATPRFNNPHAEDVQPTTHTHEESVQHLLVSIGELVFAIPSSQALEVHTSMPIRETIPYFEYCAGLVELRGESVSVLDLRMAMGHGPSLSSKRLVFIHNDSVVLAVPVDDVLEVVDAPPSEIQEIALIDRLPSASYCSRVISRPERTDAYCIDVAALFEFCSVNQECPEGMGRGLLATEEALAQSDRFYLSFRLGGAVFGVEMTDVREICNMPKLTAPATPQSAILGLINIRGDVIPVLDLRVRYGMPHDQPTEDQRVIIVEIEGKPYGLTVDALGNILSGEDTETYGPPPRSITFGQGPLSRAIGDIRELLRAPVDCREQMLLVLDPAAILHREAPSMDLPTLPD